MVPLPCLPYPAFLINGNLVPIIPAALHCEELHSITSLRPWERSTAASREGRMNIGNYLSISRLAVKETKVTQWNDVSVNRAFKKKQKKNREQPKQPQ